MSACIHTNIVEYLDCDLLEGNAYFTLHTIMQNTSSVLIYNYMHVLWTHYFFCFSWHIKDAIDVGLH